MKTLNWKFSIVVFLFILSFPLKLIDEPGVEKIQVIALSHFYHIPFLQRKKLFKFVKEYLPYFYAP